MFNIINALSVGLVGQFEPPEGNLVLFGNNPIVHDVDQENKTSTNITLPGHMFDFGTVEHSLVRSGSMIGVLTIGAGFGPEASFNEWFGSALFGLNHELMRLHAARQQQCMLLPATC